ncbi:nucleoside triphosphate diphosphatase [Methylomarinovum tepidoasis]|uniref:Nucleoside triphosphate pyrophosphohydrolase n=1 Tax=Methylomarinovum tepidoasis TaxID=2840183 RepID=A0AAU9CAM5_9GAMM|nr:nucleoside triphosphate pyrophosphohydrolase [Methylomarinovum sp. IN45]BCX89535.1 nucleoside triphosphate diphosphatase [Methylomarinovum sp. IN45]
MATTSERHPVERLLAIMARLRDPEGGCPWDRRQTFESLIPHTLEESYEVADAIERGDYDDLCDELGDLLLQVVFYARIAEERGLFDFRQVVEHLCDKLERRHPHVFAGVKFASEEERKRAWEAIKQAERRAKGRGEAETGVLGDVPVTLPALLQAEEIQNRAARHGFDWPEAEPVFAKVEEELQELREAWAGGDEAHIREEVGDLLFVAVNLARHLGVHPETALRESNRKFARRFRYMERRLAASGRKMTDVALADLDALWEEAKEGREA